MPEQRETHGVSTLGTALADRPDSTDEAGVNRLLRARATEAARQSSEGGFMVSIGHIPLT